MSFSLPNPLADIRSRTKKESQLIEQIEQDTEQAKFHNNSKQNEKVILGPLKRFCALDECPLIKTKKSDKIEGLDIEVPRYKCKTCGQIYSGFGLALFTSNKKVKAIVFEQDSI